MNGIHSVCRGDPCGRPSCPLPTQSFHTPLFGKRVERPGAFIRRDESGEWVIALRLRRVREVERENLNAAETRTAIVEGKDRWENRY
jgi:hypothetical protein